MKIILSMFFLTLFVTASSTFAESPEEKGFGIAKETDIRNSGFIDSKSTLTMALKNRHGQTSIRNMRQLMLEGIEDGDKSIIVFDDPADVKGTAALTHTHKKGDDDQWMYLPALKRIKRITASNKTGSFMGSEFSYEDLSSLEIEKYTHKWLKDEECPAVYSKEFQGSSCFVIEQYPVSKESGYSKEIVWIDKLEYRSVKIDFFDKKGELMKSLNFGGYKKYLDKFWRPDILEVINHQTLKSTKLQFQNYEFKTGLTEADFNSEKLKNIR